MEAVTGTNGRPRADVWDALNRRRPTCPLCHIDEPMVRSAAEELLAEALVAESGEPSTAFEIRDCASIPDLVHLVRPDDATEPT